MAKPAIVTVRRLFDEPSDGRAELGIAKAASIIAGRSRDAQDIDSLKKTADGLLKAAGNNQGPGADAARNLAARLSKLAAADPMARMRAQTAIATPLRYDLDQLRVEFDPQDVTIANIPEDISRQWITPDGRARVEVLPHGDPENTATLRTFVTAVLNIAPDATGPAVQLYEAGRTVVRAFIVAGIFALSAITVLLLITLRRVSDVVLTLVTAAHGRRRNAGAVCHLRLAAQLRQYHRLAIAAWRGRGIQDQLHHGLAIRKNEPAAVEPDARCDIQCADDSDSLWEPLALGKSGHIEHGQDDGACAPLHHGRRGAFSACAHGTAPQNH
jgi:hypothetical protein